METLELKAEAREISSQLQNRKCYFEIDSESLLDIEIDGILNLGVIGEYRNEYGNMLKSMIQKMNLTRFSIYAYVVMEMYCRF